MVGGSDGGMELEVEIEDEVDFSGSNDGGLELEVERGLVEEVDEARSRGGGLESELQFEPEAWSRVTCVGISTCSFEVSKVTACGVVVRIVEADFDLNPTTSRAPSLPLRSKPSNVVSRPPSCRLIVEPLTCKFA